MIAPDSPLPLWPGINAALNGLAAVGIVAGLIAVKRGNIRVHKACMGAALAVSVVFLCSYIAYHVSHRGLVTQYPDAVAGRSAYLVLLVSHTLLALPVAILAPLTAWLGWRGRIDRHRRLAKVTAPLWLYVSVTGVAVYVWLYLIAGGRPGA